jgi:hypothetical protein
MKNKVLYKSKSFSHLFLFYGLLWGVIVSSLAALPLIIVYGPQQITAYVMLKGILILFCILYVYLLTRVFLFTDVGVVYEWRYRNAKPIELIKWNDIEHVSFKPKRHSLIGRLLLTTHSGKTYKVILPEDHLDDVLKILSEKGVRYAGRASI